MAGWGGAAKAPAAASVVSASTVASVDADSDLSALFSAAVSAGAGDVMVPLHAQPTSRDHLHPLQTTFQPFVLTPSVVVVDDGGGMRRALSPMAEFCFPDGVQLVEAKPGVQPPPQFFTFVSTCQSTRTTGHVLVTYEALSPSQLRTLDLAVLSLDSDTTLQLLVPRALCLLSPHGIVPEARDVLDAVQREHDSHHPSPALGSFHGATTAETGACARCTALLDKVVASAPLPAAGTSIVVRVTDTAPISVAVSSSIALHTVVSPARSCSASVASSVTVTSPASQRFAAAGAGHGDCVTVHGPPDTMHHFLRRGCYGLNGDQSLRHLLTALNADDVMLLWQALVLERKVVMHVAHDQLGALHQVCAGLMQLLFPLQWLHTYVPVLPLSQRYDPVVGSPFPVLVGMSSRRWDTVAASAAHDAIVVNLNKGTVQVPAAYPLPPLHRDTFTKLEAQLLNAGCASATAKACAKATRERAVSGNRFGGVDDGLVDVPLDDAGASGGVEESKAAVPVVAAQEAMDVDLGLGMPGMMWFEDGAVFDATTPSFAAPWVSTKARAAAMCSELRSQRQHQLPRSSKYGFLRMRFFAAISSAAAKSVLTGRAWSALAAASPRGSLLRTLGNTPFAKALCSTAQLSTLAGDASLLLQQRHADGSPGALERSLSLERRPMAVGGTKWTAALALVSFMERLHLKAGLRAMSFAVPVDGAGRVGADARRAHAPPTSVIGRMVAGLVGACMAAMPCLTPADDEEEVRPAPAGVADKGGVTAVAVAEAL